MTDTTLADDLLHEIGAALSADPAYALPGLAAMSLVASLRDNGGEMTGYVYLQDGSTGGIIPDDPEGRIYDLLVDLREAMRGEDGAAWKQMLIQIVAGEEPEMQVAFEYEDPERWTAAAEDSGAHAESLKPGA